MFAGQAAHAFRCGSKLVTEGMQEFEVIHICGEPVQVTHLGHVLRAYDYRERSSGIRTRINGHWSPYLLQDVPVTEMVFNFGPQKFMRKLRFEGGELTDIQTLGYGYRD